MEESELYLRKLYYGVDSPIAYTSEANLWRQIKLDNKQDKITRDVLNNWLNEQYTYTLHKMSKKPSTYRKTMVKTINNQWQADLVKMGEFSKSNDNYNYILTVIDCFSRYAWVEPLKTKTALETSEAFNKIFKMGHIPLKIHFDKGKKFYNKNVKELFEAQKLNFLVHFLTKNGNSRTIQQDLEK